MKAKLTKITGIYTLLDDNDRMVASDDVDMQKDYEIGKLSTKNCDEIFGIIDVEKLAKEVLPNDDTTGTLSKQKGFVIGFNKAMELNKERYLSEETIEDNFKGLRDCIEDKEIAEFYINLAKTIFCENYPTEIEVVIEMEPYRMSDFVEDGNTHPSGVIERPKLDSEGCLILKKI